MVYKIKDNQVLVENKEKDEGRRECGACRDKKGKENKKKGKKPLGRRRLWENRGRRET